MMKTQSYLRPALIAMLLLALSPAKAEPDVWREVLRLMQFTSINHARLEFECRQVPRPAPTSVLQALCEKRYRVPDRVIEEAALPFLRKHVPEPLAKRAVVQLSSKPSQDVGQKLVTEIRTGKQDQLTQEDIVFLTQQNQSEVGRALGAFASDREQATAVVKAILAYTP